MKPTVQYDGYVGFQQRTKKIDMLDAYDYAKLSYDGHNNAYLDLLESKGIQGSITDTNDERNTKLGKKPGTINQAYLLPPEIMPYINGETGLTNTDWQDEVMRTALTHSHNLSLSGGNSSTRYFISGNYMKEEGIVIGSEFEQMGARGKVDTSYKRFALELIYLLTIQCMTLCLLKTVIRMKLLLLLHWQWLLLCLCTILMGLITLINGTGNISIRKL